MKNKNKIWIVSTQVPSLASGYNVRNYNLMKLLVQSNYKVKLFTLFDSKSEKQIFKLRSMKNVVVRCTEKKNISLVDQILVALIHKTIPYMKEFEESGLHNLIKKELLIEKPDIILLESLTAYFCIRKIVRDLNNIGIKIILDAHNVEQTTFRGGINTYNLPKKLIGYYILPNFSKLELEAINIVDHIFTCSKIDKDFFSKYVNPDKITIVPNGVDCSYFRPSKHTKEEVGSLVFMGLLSYPPNADAIKYFIDDIYPIIIKEYGKIKLIIIGKDPSEWMKKKSIVNGEIMITGYVDDVRPFLSKATVCICPLRAGSGTRLKILEYLAMGKAIVSTSLGVEGLSVTNGKNIFIMDTPVDFAHAIIKLIKDKETRLNMKKEGRYLVENQYNWKLIKKQINSALSKL